MNNIDNDEKYKRYISFDGLMKLAKDVPVGSVNQYPAEYPRADAIAQILIK